LKSCATQEIQAQNTPLLPQNKQSRSKAAALIFLKGISKGQGLAV
jgi:hypothetical protein